MRPFLLRGLATSIVLVLASAAAAAQSASDFHPRGGLERTGEFPVKGLPEYHGVAWTLKPGFWYRGPLTIAEGVLVFSNPWNQGLAAADAKTGKMIWKTELGTRMRAIPTIHGGIVFGESSENDSGEKGELVAVSLKTGKVLWRRDWPSHTAFLAATNGKLYLTIQGEFLALDAKTGKTLWSFAISVRSSACTSFPIVSKGSVYFTAGGRFLHALDAETGQEKWRIQPKPDREEENNMCFGQPMLAHDLIFSKTGATIYALEPETGKERWRTVIPAPKGALLPALTTAGGFVIARSARIGFWAWKASAGEFAWHVPAVHGLLAAASGVLYYTGPDTSPSPKASGNGFLYAFDLQSQRILWKRESPNPPKPIKTGLSYDEPTTLLVADDSIYLDDDVDLVVKLK